MDYKQILELCQKWRDVVIQPDGSGHHNAQSRELGLLYQGCKYHELGIDEIQAVCVGLTDRLHYRNGGQYIDSDQIVFWRWTAQIFSVNEVAQIIGKDIKSHLSELIFPVMFAKYDPFINVSSVETRRYNVHVEKLLNVNARVLSYLAFPLLEASSRLYCKEYIDEGGVVLKEFSGKNRNYKNGNWCSSLQDLLLLINQICPSLFSYYLEFLQQVTERITPNKSSFEAIYNWRNETLHGNDFVNSKNRIILNFAVLILLERCRPEYERLKESAITIGNEGSSNSTQYYVVNEYKSGGYK